MSTPQPVDTFALEVYKTLQGMTGQAYHLWHNEADREDALSECLVRAIEKRAQFDGSNLGGWLNRMLRNLRYDQSSKGYRKGERPEGAGDRIVYVDSYQAYDNIQNSPWALGPRRDNKKPKAAAK